MRKMAEDGKEKTFGCVHYKRRAKFVVSVSKEKSDFFVVLMSCFFFHRPHAAKKYTLADTVTTKAKTIISIGRQCRNSFVRNVIRDRKYKRIVPILSAESDSGR